MNTITINDDNINNYMSMNDQELFQLGKEQLEIIKNIILQKRIQSYQEIQKISDKMIEQGRIFPTILDPNQMFFTTATNRIENILKFYNI